MISKSQIKKIHILINALGWDDDLYRETLCSNFNKFSSKELTSGQARTLISNLEDIAEESGVWKNYINQDSSLSDRDDMATPAQIRKIQLMWKEVAYKKNQKFLKTSLRKFLEKQFKISDVRFIEKSMVSKIIKAINVIKDKSNSVQSMVKQSKGEANGY